MTTYHRLMTATQTLGTAILQTRTEEIWGTVPAQNGLFPCVKAYRGPLTVGVDGVMRNGIEFETDVSPSRQSPSVALWDFNVVPEVVVAAAPGYVKLPVKMLRVVCANSNPLQDVSCRF